MRNLAILLVAVVAILAAVLSGVGRDAQTGGGPSDVHILREGDTGQFHVYEFTIGNRHCVAVHGGGQGELSVDCDESAPE